MNTLLPLPQKKKVKVEQLFIRNTVDLDEIEKKQTQMNKAQTENKSTRQYKINLCVEGKNREQWYEHEDAP